MTRIKIDILHLRCTAAFSAYQAHMTAVLERSQGGQAPSAEDLHQEEQALYEYARIRREFLDALASVRHDEPIELPDMRGRSVGPN
jgi:hypothetical protein